MNNAHNHRIICAAALSKRDVSKETELKLKKLFESGHSPASALDTIKYDLQEQEEDNYWFVAADRSVCPDRDYCYHLYYKIFKEAYGAKGGEEMFMDLQSRLEQYNEEQGEVQQSGEMAFIDSTGNCDRQNHRLFLLLTHCSAGGLRLGVLVTTSESQQTISAALHLLTSILPREAFFGRQEKGPKVIMTDDCLTLRNSLRALYPDSTCVLCIFHLAQAMWRWLWSSHHGVLKGHRPQLMRSFQGLIYAESPASLEKLYMALTEDPVAKGHPQFLRHLAEVYARREEWAICLQSGLPTRGHHTNNFAEGAMRVLKDKVLHSLKAYNITQLVDFVHTRLEAHYIRQFTDVANNREDAMSFSVSSSTGVDRYLVSMDIGFCSCPEGVSGHCCKHQETNETIGEVGDNWRQLTQLEKDLDVWVEGLKASDSRLQRNISFGEFVIAFGVYRDILCQAYPERREEMDSYLATMANFSQCYGGTLFYEYHLSFSAKSANESP
ncbi:hypothetical protein ACEWY4_001404 [Coilia grayii]|uniref:SWIM-type domain-containing protein n=1 Tax=Coilia grayii TaxID=363190 RepID=A0ABD1KSU1_9TELE